METQEKISPEKIAEGNKLIAEFMGARVEERNDRFYFYNWTGDKKNSISNFPTTMWGTKEESLKKEMDNLLNEVFGRWGKFHKDYNWLMSVMEKIRSLGHTIEISTFFYSEKHPINNGCRITYDKQRPMTSFFFNENTDDLKICIWESVVEFIKWHNQKKVRNNN